MLRGVTSPQLCCIALNRHTSSHGSPPRVCGLPVSHPYARTPFNFAVQVTSCAPLFVSVQPDASYSAICSGDADVCKGFQPSVSSGDLHLELSNTPQTSTPTSILVTLPAAQLAKVPY